MRFLVQAAIVLSISAAVATSAKSETVCGKLDKACILTKSDKGVVDFYAINRNLALSISLYIDLELRSMDISKGDNTPIVLEPGDERWLMQIAARQGGKWSWRYEFKWLGGDFSASHDSDHVYRLPFRNGEEYLVSQGCNDDPTHRGRERYAIDFAMPDGTSIVAARGGLVVGVVESSSTGGSAESNRALGNAVAILHDDRTVAVYSHIKSQGSLVDVGDKVFAGDPIALSGNTGRSTGPHLDIAVRTVSNKQDLTLPIQFATETGVITCPSRGSRLSASDPVSFTVRE